MLISAFNALSLSPALSALLLRPRKEVRGPLGAFFRWFNRVFKRTTNGYIGFSKYLIHKSVHEPCVSRRHRRCCRADWKTIARILHSYRRSRLHVRLAPASASCLHQRTGVAAKKVEDALMHTPGIESVTSVVGFSLLSVTQESYTAFFFVTLKDWDQRTAPNEQFEAIQGSVAQAPLESTGRHRVLFPAAVDSWRRYFRRRSGHPGRPLRLGRS